MNLLAIASSYWQVALGAFFVSTIFTWIAVKVFPKFRLMDRPHRYGLKRRPIPYYGGIAIFLAFIVSSLLFVPFSVELIGLLIGGVIIFTVGLLDDAISLNPFLRLLFQFLGASVLVFSGV